MGEEKHNTSPCRTSSLSFNNVPIFLYKLKSLSCNNLQFWYFPPLNGFQSFWSVQLKSTLTCQSCLCDHNGSFCTVWIWGQTCFDSWIHLDSVGSNWIQMEPNGSNQTTGFRDFRIEPATLMPTARSSWQYLTDGWRQHLQKTTSQDFCQSTALIFTCLLYTSDAADE